MAIDRFTKVRFEDVVLPLGAEPMGMVNGEETYMIKLGRAKLIIRSSVDHSGVAGSTGEDSIRVSLINEQNRPLCSNVKDYTTRVVGWEQRLTENIFQMVGLLSQTKPCRVCGNLMNIYRVEKPGPNKGKHFIACMQFAHNELNGKFDTRLIDPSVLLSPAQLNIEAITNKTTAKSNAGSLVRNERDISRFNPSQKSVIENRARGACLIMAGAGSGKTSTMVETVINMILDGVDPARILFVTFTTKAAAEARIKIAKAVWGDKISKQELNYLGDPYNNQTPIEELNSEIVLNRSWVEADPIRKMLIDWTCTIHAMSKRLLESGGTKLNVLGGGRDGMKHKWIVDQMIKDILDEYEWKECGPKHMTAYVSYGIQAMISVGEAEEFYTELLQDYPDVRPDAPAIFAEAYKRYISYMRQHNLVDFTMMQIDLLKQLRDNPTFRNFLQNKFDYIFVDEYQDTDYIQAEIINTIADKSKNLSVVGDVRQSLYHFRGAVPEIMESDFPEYWKDNLQRFHLNINYRSTQRIVRTTDDFILHNYPGREEIIGRSEARPGAPEGKPIEYAEYDDFESMASDIVSLIAEDGKPEDWYVLSRTRAECSLIHMEFIRRKVPAVNLVGGQVFGDSHVKKVLAYAKLACNYKNARNDIPTLTEVAPVASNKFLSPQTRRRHDTNCKNDKPWVDCGCPVIIREGIDYTPNRFYGAKSIEEAGSWNGILKQRNETNRGGYPSQASKGARDLVEFVDRLEQSKDDALQVINMIIEDSVLPYLMHEEGLDTDDLAESSKMEDFDVLRSMYKPEMTLEQYLDEVESLTNTMTGNEDESVKIATVHKVKGLESKKVVVNMTRMPIIPPIRKEGVPPVGIPNTIEDERCICYTAASRSMEELYFYASLKWNGMEIPRSQFVSEFGFSFDELEEELYDIE
jgi:DNA helicase-2/ATP-dependent DNA helicase PcrA